MKTRICRLEFGVSGLADIRVLYKVWDSIWTLGDWGNNESIQVYITVDDRLPEEKVSLVFNAAPEVLDRFLGVLEQGGLKFSRNDFIPSLLIMCRIDHAGAV